MCLLKGHLILTQLASAPTSIQLKLRYEQPRLASNQGRGGLASNKSKGGLASNQDRDGQAGDQDKNKQKKIIKTCFTQASTPPLDSKQVHDHLANFFKLLNLLSLGVLRIFFFG